MFYLQYLWAELRRRPGRTVLTALGLGVGVGLVVIVGALSRGVDDDQDEVLAPLTGVGTDLADRRDHGDGVHRAHERAGMLEERPAERAGELRTGDGAVTASDQLAVALEAKRLRAGPVPKLGVEEVLEAHAAQQERRATSRSKTCAASLKPSLMVR